MKLVKIVLKNLFRHRLRTVLTMLGIATAVMAFGLIRTIVGAWNAGVAASAANRMITRHSVSFIFPVPLPYRQTIARVPDVAAVSWANWFGGVYGDPNDFKNFWPRLAVDPETYFDLYPEFQLPPDQLAAFKKERNACVIGRKLAAQHGFKIGDVITMEGDIFPGRWEWVVRGIYTGRDQTVDETQMFFQWNYLYEQVRAREPGRPVDAGWYILRVQPPEAMPRVATAIDEQFVNSRAPTKTESEKAFQQSFALLIATCGGLIGLALTFPMVAGFGKALPTFFPIINVAPFTIALALGAALIAGAVAALFPATRVVRTPIVTGLRTVG